LGGACTPAAATAEAGAGVRGAGAARSLGRRAAASGRKAVARFSAPSARRRLQAEAVQFDALHVRLVRQRLHAIEVDRQPPALTSGAPACVCTSASRSAMVPDTYRSCLSFS
jgi:hypothetical protein